MPAVLQRSMAGLTLLRLARGDSLMGLLLQGPALCRNGDRGESGPPRSPIYILQDSPSGGFLLLSRKVTQWYS